MEITEATNKVELMHQDAIKLYVTPDKVKELGVKYIVSTRDIEELDTENVDFVQIYNEQGVSIYKVN